jgi:hypothetical protein
MSLPTISAPKYTLNLPSSGKPCEYRPFLVKEEKILLIAQESEDQTQIMNAIKDVISACTFDKINPNLLTSFDLEYIFLKLRARSVGETSNISLSCSSCKVANPVEINLDCVEIQQRQPNQESRILLTDSIGVNMKYMTVQDMGPLIASASSRSQTELTTDTIIACIDSIFDADKIYPKESSTTEELVQFLNSLNRAQMKKIEDYIANMPELSHPVKFTCCSCKHPNEIVIKGMSSFFE